MNENAVMPTMVFFITSSPFLSLVRLRRRSSRACFYGWPHGWLESRRRLRTWSGKLHVLCGGSFWGREEVIGHLRIDLPVGQQQVVAQPVRIVQEDSVHHQRQFVFGPEPHLNEHAVACVSQDVGGDPADYLGLANVVGVL